MRLWILSDLHIEQSDWDVPALPPPFDVLVAAGDIHDPASEGVRWLAARAGGRPVVYVPGNHEWYAPAGEFDVASETERARAAAHDLGVHLLLDDAVIVDGVRFLGATLWTDYAFYRTRGRSMRIAGISMNDHRIIFPESGAPPLTPEQALAWHRRSVAWLTDMLAPGRHDGPTVVVTHHLPHPRSVAPRFAGDPLNPAFVSDLSVLVETGGAALWVHGHAHDSFDYRAGATRIVCNPKGYGPLRHGGRIENAAFDPLLTVEIADGTE